MNRKTINVAISILLSLGITACSSSSGGSDNAVQQDNGTDIKNNIDSNNNDSNGNNNSNGNSGTKRNNLSPRPLTPEELAAEKAKEEAEKAAKKAAEQAAKDAAKKAAEEEAAKKASITKHFANGNSAAYIAASDPAIKASVTNTIDLGAGTCDTSGSAPACYDRSIEKGKVLATQKQAYSSFASLRETFNAASPESEPVNSYVYFVGTPTTDVAAVVDANYIGAAKFSAGNRLEVVDATVLLSVKDSKLTGGIYTPSTSVMAEFNESEVKIINGTVGFNGTASFVGAPFGLPGGIDGTYKGVFAGSNAEEVVGTFESSSTERTKSIQGAFAATKR